MLRLFPSFTWSYFCLDQATVYKSLIAGSFVCCRWSKAIKPPLSVSGFLWEAWNCSGQNPDGHWGYQGCADPRVGCSVRLHIRENFISTQPAPSPRGGACENIVSPIKIVWILGWDCDWCVHYEYIYIYNFFTLASILSNAASVESPRMFFSLLLIFPF